MPAELPLDAASCAVPGCATPATRQDPPKTLEIGLWQLGHGLGKGHDEQNYPRLCTGIVASTIAEVRFFAQDRRFSDILLGMPLCISKIAPLLRLHITSNSKLHVLIDHSHTLTTLLEAFKVYKENEGAFFGSLQPLGVFIKIDCGYHRVGLDPMTQMGEIEHLVATILGQGKSWLSFLTKRGFPLPIVSIGATPSCSVLLQSQVLDVAREEGEKYRSLLRLLLQRDVPWELHPGNYSLYDVMQLRIGACGVNEIACSVASRVLSVYPAQKQLIVDAGGAALSKDSIAHEGNVNDLIRWGIIAGKAGSPRMSIKSVSQECSVVDFREEDLAKMPMVGDKIYILPVHACMAAMCHPHYYLNSLSEEIKGRHDKNYVSKPIPATKITPCKYWS